jgi:hypothetical protein
MREFPKDNTVSQIEKPRSSITVQNEVEPIPAFEAPFRCAPSHKGHIHMPRESNLDIFLSKLDLGIFECQTQNYQTVAENAAIQPGLHPLSLDRAGLEQTALRIRQKLEAAAIAVNQPNTPSKELLDSIQIVTAKNIPTWTRLYFRHFHKHGPVVHEATFNPATSALPLVLAIITIGAMASLPMPPNSTSLTGLLVFYWGVRSRETEALARHNRNVHFLVSWLK